MNSSDEATLRFTLVNAMMCYLAKGREPKMEDAPAAAVQAMAVVEEFAANVRAGAVADERLKGWTPFGTHVDVVLPADRVLEFSDNDEAGIPRWERIVTRAAGSVPAATPPVV